MTTVVNNSTKNLCSMRARVYFFIRADCTSTLFPKAMVDDVINVSLNKVNTQLNKDWTTIQRCTQVGCAGYTIPEPVMEHGNAIVDAVFIDGEEITAQAYEELEAGCVGEPANYWVSGNGIFLNPPADGCYVLKIRYRREFPKLTTGASESTMPDIQIDAALAYAAYLLKIADEETTMAIRYKEIFDELIDDARRMQPGVYKAADVTFGGAQ